jgi:hypothetical protein
MKSKQTQDTHWRIMMKDGLEVRCTGKLAVTRKRTALIGHDCDGGRRFLVFGGQSKMIESIEAVEDRNGRQ